MENTHEAQQKLLDKAFEKATVIPFDIRMSSGYGWFDNITTMKMENRVTRIPLPSNPKGILVISTKLGNVFIYEHKRDNVQKFRWGCTSLFEETFLLGSSKSNLDFPDMEFILGVDGNDDIGLRIEKYKF